jgi:hypothetical protein
MSHYLHYSYEDKKEVFEKYWELIREWRRLLITIW